MKGHRLGLSLLELLVVLAIIGVVMTMLLNWQMNTLSVTMRTNALSRSLTDLNDVTGYIGDRVRAAKAIRTTGFTVNGKACDATTPCLGMLTTVEKDGTGQWFYMVYRMEPRSTWRRADYVADHWADDPANKVFVLSEYRLHCEQITPTACDTFMNNFVTATAFSDLQPVFVTDYLSLEKSNGTAITPFEYTAGEQTVKLSFQQKRSAWGRVTFTPTPEPYTLTVRARNTF